MDKYQEYLMNKVAFEYVDERTTLRRGGLKAFQASEGQLSISQNEDITVGGYELRLLGDVIEKAYALKGKKRYLFKRREPSDEAEEKRTAPLSLPIDFDSPMDSIVLQFKNGLADELTIPMKYCAADKQAYYERKEKERLQTLLADAHISDATACNLVNIYFQPCCSEYGYTEISLFHDEFRIARYRVAGDLCFLAIPNLATGRYQYSLTQYDKDGNAIVSSDKKWFSINPTRGF